MFHSYSWQSFLLGATFQVWHFPNVWQQSPEKSYLKSLHKIFKQFNPQESSWYPWWSLVSLVYLVYFQTVEVSSACLVSRTDDRWSLQSHMLHVWYIFTYICLGDFYLSLGQMVGFIFQHHASHLGNNKHTKFLRWSQRIRTEMVSQNQKVPFCEAQITGKWMWITH